VEIASAGADLERVADVGDDAGFERTDDLRRTAAQVIRSISDRTRAATMHRNPIESDHGRLKARTRPMRGLKRLRCAQVVCSGHAFVQNLRRGHYEFGHDTEPGRRLEAIFTELALVI
jgi:hypothetical protein